MVTCEWEMEETAGSTKRVILGIEILLEEPVTSCRNLKFQASEGLAERF
jgi:hypothetical protein